MVEFSRKTIGLILLIKINQGVYLLFKFLEVNYVISYNLVRYCYRKLSFCDYSRPVRCYWAPCQSLLSVCQDGNY